MPNEQDTRKQSSGNAERRWISPNDKPTDGLSTYNLVTINLVLYDKLFACAIVFSRTFNNQTPTY